MPSIVIKAPAGISFPKGKETIELQGNGVINFVSEDDLKYLRENHNLDKYVDKGYIVIGADKNASDDLKQETLDAQENNIKSNAKNNNVKLEKN